MLTAPVGSTNQKAPGETNRKHQADRHPRSSPGLVVPLLERKNRVLKDLQGKRGHGLTRTPLPVRIPEGSKEERGRFASNTGEGNQYSRHDSAPRRRQHDASVVRQRVNPSANPPSRRGAWSSGGTRRKVRGHRHARLPARVPVASPLTGGVEAYAAATIGSRLGPQVTMRSLLSTCLRTPSGSGA